MIRKSIISLMATLLAVMFTSCSSDNDDYILRSPDCAITKINMGLLYRHITTKLPDGRDTAYNITVPGAAFPLHIDQLKGEIYNTDSLPMGTILQKTVFANMEHDGTVLIRKADGVDTLYNTKDTIDCSFTRTFTVYASDGTGSRSYNVKINVHQVNPEAYTWTPDGSANEQLAAMSGMKTVISNDSLYVWGKKDGKAVLMKRQNVLGAGWTSCETSGLEDAAINSIIAFDGSFYATGQSGLKKSADGTLWEAVTTDITPVNIMGADPNRIYVSTTDGAYSSTDGATWTQEEMDADVSLLPQTNVMTVTQPTITNKNIQNVITVGYIGESSVVWKKEIDLTGVATNPWSYFPYTEENKKSLPFMESVSLMKYEHDLYAAGIKNGKVMIYVSQDGARTWLKDSEETILPARLGAPTEINFVTDDDDYIWLVCAGTGQVWRGYLNRLKDISNNQ